MSSRWADTEDDLAEAARLKAEKAARRAAKEERKRREEEEAAAAAAAAATAAAATVAALKPKAEAAVAAQQDRASPRPSKRQRTSNYTGSDDDAPEPEIALLRFPSMAVRSCRHVETSYERLNHIEEGSYGIVSRARDLDTGEIVALKRLKLERETDGFPITSLREVTTLMAARDHPNIVRLREVVMGDTLKELLFPLPSPPFLSVPSPLPSLPSVPFPLSFPSLPPSLFHACLLIRM